MPYSNKQIVTKLAKNRRNLAMNIDQQIEAAQKEVEALQNLADAPQKLQELEQQKATEERDSNIRANLQSANDAVAQFDYDEFADASEQLIASVQNLAEIVKNWQLSKANIKILVDALRMKYACEFELDQLKFDKDSQLILDNYNRFKNDNYHGETPEQKSADFHRVRNDIVNHHTNKFMQNVNQTYLELPEDSDIVARFLMQAIRQLG